ncbi:MAG: TRAP transporter small permease subunit [Myxococcales bacterium]|nr:TRAP transporter small permease subunit [Myxococcales bacterium]
MTELKKSRRDEKGELIALGETASPSSVLRERNLPGGDASGFPSANQVPRWVAALARLINGLGQGISWLCLLMVILMTLVVVFRYVLDMGSIAVQETVIYMHAWVIMVGASYALLHDAHVRVDVLYRGWTPKSKARVDVGGALVFLFPLCVFTIYISLSYVINSWRILEGSAEAGGLPAVFVLKSLIILMAFLLILAGIVRLYDSVAILRGRAEEQS